MISFDIDESRSHNVTVRITESRQDEDDSNVIEFEMSPSDAQSIANQLIYTLCLAQAHAQQEIERSKSLNERFNDISKCPICESPVNVFQTDGGWVLQCDAQGEDHVSHIESGLEGLTAWWRNEHDSVVKR